MADVHSQEQRSRNMAAIRAKDTSPEIAVRRLLHRLGYRYRLHVKDLPGKPDIVLPRFHAIVEVRGCFWHRHPGCRYATSPATRQEFWQAKFKENMARDRRVEELLSQQGWRLEIVWECEIREMATLETKLVKFLSL
ncbi:MAG: very short patch repair endonuclease [Candidatus Sumerlaeaceae bacterium]